MSKSNNSASALTLSAGLKEVKMSSKQKLKRIHFLNKELIDANLRAVKISEKNDDPSYFVTMAEALKKHCSIEKEIRELSDEIARENLWIAKLTPASEIEIKVVEWLWPGWIPAGKMTLLAGNAGSGKTTMALGFAATVSTAGQWPDGIIFPKEGNVIVWSGEDDPSDTLVPRLKAAGANLSRVRIVEGRTKFGCLQETERFVPSRDLDTLSLAVSEIGGASLLIIDPIVSLIKGDMHRANEVRNSLEEVVAFAEKHSCAVVGITHFNKGSSGRLAIDRVLGSQAFAALSRTTLVVGVGDASEEKVLAKAKTNIASDQGGHAFSIKSCTVKTDDGRNIDSIKIEWGEFVKGSATQIISALEDGKGGESDAVLAMREILVGGRIASGKVNSLMQRDGFTEKQIRVAREKLRVKIDREGSGESHQSFWSLPNT